jgi:hypothetical protein
VSRGSLETVMRHRMSQSTAMLMAVNALIGSADDGADVWIDDAEAVQDPWDACLPDDTVPHRTTHGRGILGLEAIARVRRSSTG